MSKGNRSVGAVFDCFRAALVDLEGQHVCPLVPDVDIAERLDMDDKLLHCSKLHYSNNNPSPYNHADLYRSACLMRCKNNSNSLRYMRPFHRSGQKENDHRKYKA